MDAVSSANVIRATQDTLGKFVKRPPLTEKLLKKPPFRFLHDIITSVLRSDGFFEGLFEEAELISENVKDREAKILFLSKVISVLSTTTGKSIAAKPSKIISGQEPEKTNELLLFLGQALEQNLSTSEAVKKYKQKLNIAKADEIKNGKKLRDQSTGKPPAKPKDSKSDISLKSKGNEKPGRQSEAKESNILKRDTTKKEKQKRDASNSRDAQKSRRDNSKTRKGTDKEKTELVKDERKEKLKFTDEPSSKLKSQERMSNASPPKSQDINKVKKTEDHKKSIAETDTTELNKTGLRNSNSVNLNHDNIKNSLYENENNKNYVQSKDKSLEYMTNSVDIHEQINTSMKLLPENGFNDNKENNTSSVTPMLEPNDLQNGTNINNDDILSTNMALGPAMLAKTSENPIIKPTSASKINYEVNTDTTKTKIESPIHNPLEQSISRTSTAENISRPDTTGIKPSTPAQPTKGSFLRPPTARPPSARPGAPRLRDRHEDMLTANDPVPISRVNVIVENAENDAEEEASLVYIETEGEQQVGEEGESGTDVMMLNASGDHGHLVQQILESQKEYSKSKTSKTEIEWEIGAQRAREASSQEVEQLRFTLQALSRAANPLVKILDHIQEDVEVMRQELQQWTKTYEDAKIQLAKQKSDTDLALQPLEAKIKQLEEETREKHDKIDDLKSVIHKNSMRINKLLESGYVQ